ncbi:hypothetical protein [Microbacterium sp. YY-01]|uniref:hypothetical protein n=1 Tax=Microbacterium sp. YY-01 TaxID=3421634 RepID=UPI003D165BD3
MGSFIVFVVLFLSGVWLTGYSQEMTEYPALFFTLGLLLVSGALAWAMRAAGSATVRTKQESGDEPRAR